MAVSTVVESIDRCSRNGRRARWLSALLAVLCLVPMTLALAFPDPDYGRLCDRDREAPPRLASDQTEETTTSTSPSVRILNPLRAASPTKVSDRYDGTDRRYHITAVAIGVPQEAVLEAFVKRGTSTEEPVGILCPVAGTRDTFEGFWDIPDVFAEGNAELIVKAFDRLGDDAQVIAIDQVSVNMQHRDAGTPASEDVRVLWPPNDGPLGFSRNRSGEWKTSLQATTRQDAPTPTIRYSTAPLESEPAFRACAGLTTTTSNRGDQTIVDLVCRLATGDRPSAITAIAAVAAGGADSSDAHRIHPFIQSASSALVSLTTIYQTPFNAQGSTTYPGGRRRVAGAGCLELVATATDQFGRPMIGANVDAELRGPGEGASFALGSSTAAPPDKATVTENTITCEGGPNAAFRQARSVVSGGPDAKAIESVDGTDDRGRWGFKIFSNDPGASNVKVWVDEETLASDTHDRVADDDQHGESEGVGTIEAQWLDRAIDFGLDPRGESATIGTCRLYTLTTSAGSSGLDNFNVDFHVRVPDAELKLCGPATLTPPDSGHAGNNPHPVDPLSTPAQDSRCPGAGPPCHHLEGVTDEDGELVFGISSGVPGTATITAWADGEPGQDDDLKADIEASAAVETVWVSEARDSKLRLLMPSTGGDVGAELQRVSTDSLRILARVGAPYLIQGVSIEATFAGTKYMLGEAKRVGHTNLYEFVWDLTRPLSGANPAPTASPSTASPSPAPSESGSPSTSASPSPTPGATVPPLPLTTRPGVADGNYDITARPVGSASFDTYPVQINRNNPNSTSDTTTPWETVQLTAPKNGDPLGFDAGAATISGTASSGAEGVDFFYSISANSEKPVWRRCGYVSLGGSARTNSQQALTAQSVVGTCELKGNDKPAEVNGVAAVAFNCDIPTSGCANRVAPPLPGGAADPRQRSQRATTGAGDAIAVTGCAGSLCLVLFPPEWRATTETCVPLAARVAAKNKPDPGQRVEVEFQGPSDRIHFCDPADPLNDTWPGTEYIASDPYGPDIHRISGITDARGTFEFGIFSSDSNFRDVFSASETSFSLVRAWIDDGDATPETGESSHTATMHWELPGRCTVIGTDRGETLNGTLEADKICGLGGNDVIYGFEGDDLILGGTGNDTIHGDEGRDVLLGETGDDNLFGGDGTDTLDGGDGSDDCDPGPGKKQTTASCETVVEPKKKAGYRARGAI